MYAVDCNCMSLTERIMQNAYLCNGTAFQRIIRIMEIMNIRKMMHIYRQCRAGADLGLVDFLES